MDELTADDVKKAMKMLHNRFGDERLKPIAAFLASNIEILQSITKTHLPKEIEPAGYIRALSGAEQRLHCSKQPDDAR